MKRLSVLSIVLLFLFACEGDPGPMGPSGPMGPPGEEMNLTTVKYTFLPEDWRLEGEANVINSRWVASFSLEDITNHIYNDGTIIVYYYPEGRGRIKTPLPYVLSYGIVEETKEYRWSQVLHYEVEEGMIHFYLTYSDFATNVEPSEALGYNMDIDIVLLWK